jgi:uncharacterized membrane protein YgcG
MTRHYLEGLLFTLLSLFAFLQARSSGRIRWAWAGAAAYALAASAKEVYVPLVLVLACLPEPCHADDRAQVPSRWRLLLPYALVALGYVAWRSVMLGDVVGGYGAGQSLLSAASMRAMAQALARLRRRGGRGRAAAAVAAGDGSGLQRTGSLPVPVVVGAGGRAGGGAASGQFQPAAARAPA